MAENHAIDIIPGLIMAGALFWYGYRLTFRTERIKPNSMLFQGLMRKHGAGSIGKRKEKAIPEELRLLRIHGIFYLVFGVGFLVLSVLLALGKL